MINQINENFHKMGVLLFLDSPLHLHFGIDNITWTVGDKFKGIKLIPLGTHIINYSLADEKHMFPIHKFVNFSSDIERRILVFRWNQSQQKFMEIKGQQANGYREGVKKYHFDSYLGPYPQENIEFWKQNTRYIHEKVLQKLDPIDYFIDAAEEYSQKENHKIEEKINIDQDDDDEPEDIEDNQPDIVEEKKITKAKDFGGNIYYSQIPRRLKKDGDHVSNINIDKTQILEKVIFHEWKNKQLYLLGELQYSFVSFLIGQNLDSYTQWKQLMFLFVYSETAFKHRKQLMLQFIVILYEQLQQFPQDFFYDQLSKDNFLCPCLGRLKDYTIENQIGKKAILRIRKLLGMIETRFQYHVHSDQEQSPVMVEESQSYF